LLEEGKFAELRARDAALYGSLPQLALQEREALIGYLQSQVPLNEFEWAAYPSQFFRRHDLLLFESKKIG
jgi:hypothetical protein